MATVTFNIPNDRLPLIITAFKSVNGIYPAGLASYVGSNEFYLRDSGGSDLGIGNDRGIAACNIRYIIQ